MFNYLELYLNLKNSSSAFSLVNHYGAIPTWDDEAAKVMLSWLLMLWHAELHEYIDSHQSNAYKKENRSALWLNSRV
jgi:hypothetical protein